MKLCDFKGRIFIHLGDEKLEKINNQMEEALKYNLFKLKLCNEWYVDELSQVLLAFFSKKNTFLYRIYASALQSKIVH